MGLELNSCMTNNIIGMIEVTIIFNYYITASVAISYIHCINLYTIIVCLDDLIFGTDMADGVTVQRS